MLAPHGALGQNDLPKPKFSVVAQLIAEKVTRIIAVQHVDKIIGGAICEDRVDRTTIMRSNATEYAPL